MSSGENTVHYHFHVSAPGNGQITINFNTEESTFKVGTTGQQQKIVIEPLDIPQGSITKNDCPVSTKTTIPAKCFNFGDNLTHPAFDFSGKRTATSQPEPDSKFKLEPLKLPEQLKPSSPEKGGVIGTDCMGFQVMNKKNVQPDNPEDDCSVNALNKIITEKKRQRPIADNWSQLSANVKSRPKRTTQHKPFSFGGGA